MPNWFWDPNTYQYTTSAGEVLTRQGLLFQANASIEISSFKTLSIAEAGLSPNTFIAQMRAELKGEYIRQYLLGRGGLSQMTPADWGSVGGALKEQYRYLDNLAIELATGELSDAQIASRMRMYANSARESFERARAKTVRLWGADQEAWENDGFDNCIDCIDMQDEGWQELGYFPVPGQGQTVCLTNCHCTKRYRKSKSGVEYG